MLSHVSFFPHVHGSDAAGIIALVLCIVLGALLSKFIKG